MWVATSGSHGSSSAMKQWAAADNNNVFIVCVNTFNSETKSSSYSYSQYICCYYKCKILFYFFSCFNGKSLATLLSLFVLCSK